MPGVKIEREAVERFGGQEALDALIDEFRTALRDHAKTVNIPAPTAHPYVERIVRQFGGLYEIIEPVSVEPAPELTEPEWIAERARREAEEDAKPVPEPIFDELLAQKYNDLAYVRNVKRCAGVMYWGHKFWSDLTSLSELIAAKDIARDDPTYTIKWKTADNQFVMFGANDIAALVNLIRAHTQNCFNREAHIIATRLSRIKNIETLQTFDAAAIWEAE